MLRLLQNKNFLLVLLVLISLFSIIPLFHKGFFLSDDGEWMVIRFSAFHQALTFGQFPVRFLPRLNFGYGYSVANFLYPGFMYLAEIPKLLKISFVDSIKIVLGVSMVSSLIFCFLWLSKIFDKTAAFFGALFFLYSPYHFYDLYKRGSVGEILALSVIPFVLWQIEREDLLWSSLGFGFLLISHNTLALLFTPLIILYMGINLYVSKNKTKLKKKYAKMFLFGFGISAFFWIPAIFDLSSTVFSKTQVSDWADHFADINLAGIVSLLIAIAIILFFVLGKLKIKEHRLTALFLLVGVFSLFLSLSLSSPLWKILPVSFIQFPFRFLSLTIISTSFLGACLVCILPKNVKVAAGVVIFLLSIYFSRNYMSPSVYFDKGDGFYATNQDTTTVKNEYMPKWVTVLPKSLPQQKLVALGGVINSQRVHPNNFLISIVGPSTLTINTIYFPGWRAIIDSQALPIQYNNPNGVMQISVPSGVHQIRVWFGETPLRLV